jgi:putative oxidoreductase
MSEYGAGGMVRRLALKGLTVLGALAFLAPLLTRVVLGQSFYHTGLGKLMDLGKVTGFFTDLGIPFPALNAAFVSGLEFVGGICLLLGLGTRIFAFLLSGSMVVALLTADKQAFLEKFPADITDITSFAFLLFLMWLVLYGPGPVSLDHLIAKRLGLGPPVTEPAPAPPERARGTAR